MNRILFKLEINEKVELKKYMSIEFKENVYKICQKEKVVYEGEIEGLSKYFKLRKELKCVALSHKEGVYEFILVRAVSLHSHTTYSLLDGGCKPKALANKAEYSSAITDHGVMHGIVEFHKEMQKQDKHAIIGFEAYVENIDGEKKSNHLLLLAKNEVGYKNLIKLTSKAYSNFYRKPHVSYEMLREHSEGVIATSACLGGEISRLISKDNYEKAKEVAITLNEIFRNEDFYIEIQRHNMGREEAYTNKGLIQLSKELGIKLVATTDSHYENVEDKESHQVLLCINTKKTMQDPTKFQFEGDGYHILSPEEFEEKFKDIPEAIDSTLEIAEKCEFELKLGEVYMPHFTVPSDFENEDEYFRTLCFEGFKKRFEGTDNYMDTVYAERLEYEVETIIKLKYSGYFLIVWDFIKYAKDNGIMVGPGRGSAVGSLVSYCLEITDADPIKYGLLFERFLNPERVSMPDIDIDFEDERRVEVIDYVKNKYGEECVSKIITFGTFASKMAIRDIVRVLDYPYTLGDKLAKLIPNTPGITITKALEEVQELDDAYRLDSDAKTVIDLALSIEGLKRHTSQHACGLIIADGRVDNYVPEMMLLNPKTKEKERTVQVNMSEAEDMGLLKMDFLGLRTMGVIGNSIKLINKNAKKEIIGDYSEIPMNNPYVYKDISRGKTFGVFQIEGNGMRDLMKKLYKDVSSKIATIEEKFGLTKFGLQIEAISGNLEDKDYDGYVNEMTIFGEELFERLVAGVSLFRPGPIEYIPEYIQGIENPDYITYKTPKLEPILKATYGVIVYQEQVLKIVQELAGYSLGRADIVRRAMGKKKMDVMEEEKEFFINGKLDEEGNIEVMGCVRNGIDEKIALDIWNNMVDFANYAFNKSHSVAYSLLSAITAWLKLYYPKEFMASVLNSFIKKSDKLKVYLPVCEDMDIEILPPHVNNSSEFFEIEGEGLRFGLNALKNLGAMSSLLVEERASRGDFIDYQDLIVRMSMHQDDTKKNGLEALVYSGALDDFEYSRKSKIDGLPQIVKHSKTKRKDFINGQESLFEMVDFREYDIVQIEEKEEYDTKFKLQKEREIAGIYITENPLDSYLHLYKEDDLDLICDYTNQESDEGEEDGNIFFSELDGQKIKVIGIISNVQIRYARASGNKFKTFTIEDKTGELDCVMFSKGLDAYDLNIVDDEIVKLEGFLKQDDRGIQVMANSAVDIKILGDKGIPKCLKINSKGNSDKYNIQKLQNIIDNNEGDIPVYIVNGENITKSNKNIVFSAKTFLEIQNMFGTDAEYIY